VSVPAPASRPSAALRVAIVTDDLARRAGWAAIVAASGHEVVPRRDYADVVLADIVEPSADTRAVVTLGVEELGQAGMLPRDATQGQIDAALRAVAAGLIVRTAAAHQPAFRPLPSEEAVLLTPREIEVLAAIGDGLSNKEAARRLGISQHTVKFHLESVFRKLAVTSRAEAVHKGLRSGLIEL
jgi:two-component system, NarL family, nitrate/nitrite response regulator NarL